MEGDDALAVIAESYRGIHESTKTIAQATLQMRETQAQLVETQRLGLRLQGFGLRLQACALALIGLSLLFTGYVVWQHLAMRHESAVLNQAVLTNTQTIAAQTQAILERLRQP